MVDRRYANAVAAVHRRNGGVTDGRNNIEGELFDMPRDFVHAVRHEL